MTEYIINKPTSWKISHRWQTGIQTALTGSEKRSAILDQPFVEMEPGYMSGDYRTNADFRGKLFRGTHELWRVPVWSDRTYLTSAIPVTVSGAGGLPDPPGYVDGTPESMKTLNTFDGTASTVLEYPSYTAIQMEEEDWTLQAWVKMNAVGRDDYVFMFKGKYGGKGVFLPVLSLGTSSDYFYARIDTTGSHITSLFSTTEPAADTWYYITLTYNSALGSNQLKMYVNGTLESETNASGFDLDDTEDLLVGANNYNGVLMDFMDGQIQDAYWSKGIVRWTSNFTPPERGHSSGSEDYSIVEVEETSNRRFFPNRDLIVTTTDLATYEYATISGISGNTITLTSDLTNSYPVGSYVLPAYECRLNDSNEITQQVRDVSSWKLSFTEAYESDRDYQPTAVTWSGTTYSGLDVFEWAPSDFLKFGTTHDYELLNYYAKGVEYSWYDNNESILTIEGNYLLNTRTKIWNVFKFFDSKLGRYDKFWVPTWNKDLVITEPFTAADTVISVSPNSSNVYYDDANIINRHLMFVFPDASRAYREVTTFSGSSITLNSPIGYNGASGYARTYVSFLVLSRFDVDKITAIYEMEEIANFPLYFKGLIDEDI